jgi:mannose/fructose/N-acetylgalactosamine-specific phosphotransferase system component IIC
VSLVTSGILCAAGLSVLELDAAAIGPFLLSRPFVIGPLLGVVLGDIWAGAFFGLVFETLSLSEMPLGGSLKLSAPIAVGVAVWLFLCVPGFSKEAAK